MLTGGPHVTITHDALDLTAETPPSPEHGSSLDRDPSPDIWRSFLETHSDTLSTYSRRKQVVRILLEYFLLSTVSVLGGNNKSFCCILGYISLCQERSSTDVTKELVPMTNGITGSDSRSAVLNES